MIQSISKASELEKIPLNIEIKQFASATESLMITPMR